MRRFGSRGRTKALDLLSVWEPDRESKAPPRPDPRPNHGLMIVADSCCLGTLMQGIKLNVSSPDYLSRVPPANELEECCPHAI